MNKKFFLILILIFVSSLPHSPMTYAKTCFEKLLWPNGTHSTNVRNGGGEGEIQHFYFSNTDFTFNHDLSYISNARSALKLLAKKMGCDMFEIKKKASYHTESCLKYPGISQKRLCVLERDIGIFIFTIDYLEGASVLFQRWD